MAVALQDCLLIQYADDSQILISGNIHELNLLIKRAEDLLNKAKRYFQINGLNINESKTKCMFIGSRQYIAQIPDNTVLNFNGHEIEKSEYVKNLGVYYDQYMLFNFHINEISRKVNGTLIYLNRRDRITRANNDLYVQRTATDIGGRSLIKTGSLLWNKLPNTLKRENSINSFKLNLKKYFLSS